MNLDIGSEKRFLEFISGLNDKDKIALVSHTDLDGIVAARVVDKVIDVNFVKFVNYSDINEGLIKEIKKNKINKVVFTDLFFKDAGFIKKLEANFDKILILDHHPSVSDFNSSKCVFIKGEEGYSAGYLCYDLFSKIQDLKKIDWLVACCCISDYCHKKPFEWLKKVFEKYGDKFEMVDDYVRKDGKFWDLQWKISLALIYFRHDLNRVYDAIKDSFGNIGDLEHYAKEVQDEIELNLKKFEEEKISFKNGYLFYLEPKFPCSSIIANIISQKEHDKAYIMVRPIDEKKLSVSVRRQDLKMDMGKFLQEVLRGFDNASGGGHVPAAGGYFLRKDFDEFKDKLGDSLGGKA